MTNVVVEWHEEEIVVHDVMSLDAAAPTWTRPKDDDVEWTRGELTGDGPADVILTVDGISIPVGRLAPAKATKWRSAGPAVSVVPR